MASKSNTAKLLEFMMLIGRLKATKRAGWVQRGITEPESVAGHMYRMGVMAFLTASDKTLNNDRCLKMALVHDMAESIVGDITPADCVSKEEKHRREKNAMEHIKGLVSEDVGTEFYTLWQEYEDQSTPEASFVKDLDKFDMILQAYEYEQTQKGPSGLQEFFDSTEGQFQHPSVKEWVRELNQSRASPAVTKPENISKAAATTTATTTATITATAEKELPS